MRPRWQKPCAKSGSRVRHWTFMKRNRWQKIHRCAMQTLKTVAVCILITRARQESHACRLIQTRGWRAVACKDLLTCWKGATTAILRRCRTWSTKRRSQNKILPFGISAHVDDQIRHVPAEGGYHKNGE